MTHLPDLTAAIIGSAATLAALVIIGRAIRSAGRWLAHMTRMVRAIEHVVQRELDHNHGSSLKDDVTGIALAVGKLGRQVDDLAVEHRDDTAALAARIDHYHPPEEETPA